MKNKLLAFFEYFVVFVGLSATYIFSVPGSDNYYFTADYENTLSSIWYNSLHYGNGRLAGNLLGIWSSINFVSAFILVALLLTVLIFAINKFFFDGNALTVFPIAMLIAFPHEKLLSSVYIEAATVANYVFPVVLVFLCLCLLKFKKSSKIQPIYALATFILAAIACLCSENTTILIFTLAVLCLIYEKIKNRKISLVNIFFAAGSIVGGLGMILIPKLAKSESELDFYRSFASSPLAVVKQCVVNFSTFSDVLASFALPIAIISAGVIVALLKHSSASRRTKTILISCLSAVPIEFAVYAVFSQNSPYSIYMFSVQTVCTIAYAAVLVISLLTLKKSEFKTVFLGVCILVLFSVAPVMIVNICGYRTFYHTYMVLVAFAAYCAKYIYSQLHTEIPEKFPKATVKKACSAALAFVFVIGCSNLFIQSVYNYNCYVDRTQSIVRQINDRCKCIEVSPLPCGSQVCEDDFPSLLNSLVYKLKLPDDYNMENFKVVTFSAQGGYDNSYSIVSQNPLTATLNAFKNIKYKNVSVFYEMIDELE